MYGRVSAFTDSTGGLFPPNVDGRVKPGPPGNTPVRPQLQVETFRIGLYNLLIGEAFSELMHRGWADRGR